MISMLKTELIELYTFLKRNSAPVVVISLSTLFLMLSKYHPLSSPWQTYMLYYFTLPVISIVVVLRRNPLDFGLRPGHYKIWGFHLLAALPIIFGIVCLLTAGEDVQRYYQARNFNPADYMVDAAIRLFAWEFLFRGFMLFGLKDRMKEAAILVQMIPFALLHLGKPETETISCIVSGIYFGYVCYRGGAFWPAFILHVFINYSIKFLSIYHF
jgi:membrane protease YdiL (CAAX protease family)